jgi:hypothetical protein
MAPNNVDTVLACQPNLKEWSGTFAALIRHAREQQALDLKYLWDMTHIDTERLRTLEAGETIFTSREIQLLGIVLGVGVDDLFPLPTDLSPQRIHGIFAELLSQNCGLYAATSGPDAATSAINQEAFERSVVHLHHCAECLAKFPS